MRYPVKLSGLLLFFCVVCLAVKAQQKHFIYVQSEGQQQFAVIMDGKVYSSSDYGYVIIPKLDDGEYKFTVSFPLNKFPDQAFSCTINKKDAGFFLKNGANGWALENMQSQKSLASSTAKANNNNAFSDMLSDVVSDSTLNQPVVTAPPPEAEKPVIDAGNAAEIAPAATETVAAHQPEKIGELKGDTGTNLVFVDQSQSGIDTISVFIPADQEAKISKPAEETAANNTIPQDSSNETAFQNTNPPEIKQEAKASEPVFLDHDKPADSDSEKTTSDISNPFYNAEENKTPVTSAPVETNTEAAAPTENNSNNTVVNNAAAGTRQDCDDMLSDDTFSKLKRKMFSQDNDDAMVRYAVKFIGKKCISTDQVKALGSLFSSDDGRYNLYDALYKYVYDYGNYASLSGQILDPYYKKRFAALLR